MKEIKSAEEIFENHSRSIPEEFEGELGDILEDYPEISFVAGENVMLKNDFLEAVKELQFTPAIVGDGVEDAAEKYYWEQKSKKRTMGVYHAVEDFKAGWKAAQEQPVKQK